MNQDDLVGALAFGTIGIVLLLAAVLLVRFLSKPRNQHPLAGKQERNIGKALDEADPEVPTRRNIK